jgi:hypothetical protein
MIDVTFSQITAAAVSLAHSMISAGSSRDGRLEVCARQGSLKPQLPHLMHPGSCGYPPSVLREMSVNGRGWLLSVQSRYIRHLCGMV